MSKKSGHKIFLLTALVAAVVALCAVFAWNFYQSAAYPVKYLDIVDVYSEKYGVDKALVMAVIKCESSFNKDAVSEIGASGLMQITDETFEWAQSRMGDASVGYDRIFEPETNIKHGTYILKLLIDEFEDEKTALSAYHAGFGNVKNWLEDKNHSLDGKNIDTTPGRKTNAYIARVLKVRKVYEKKLT